MYYCHLSSPTTISDTNLQLYSLYEAARCWNKLIELLSGDNYGEGHIKERQVFTLNCFGLSLTQLLGQNAPPSNKGKIDSPKILIKRIFKHYHITQDKQDYLNKAAEDFFNYYDKLRHFGKQYYKFTDELTLETLNQFRSTTIDIWDTMLAIFKKNKKNELDAITSITQIVWFNDPPQSIVQTK